MQHVELDGGALDSPDTKTVELNEGDNFSQPVTVKIVLLVSFNWRFPGSFNLVLQAHARIDEACHDHHRRAYSSVHLHCL